MTAMSARVPTVDDLRAEVDRQSLMAHVAEFARRVKLSGTPDEFESFRYLEGSMRGYGYRTELVLHDAYISLPGRCVVKADGHALKSITHSMSAGTSGTIEAPLVSVGDGKAAHFAGKPTEGAILLVEGIADEDVAVRAVASGAIGAIHISPNEHLYEMCISPVWGSPSDVSRSSLPNLVVATIARADGEMLLRRLGAGEPVRASMQTEVDTGWRKIPLLACDLAAPQATDDDVADTTGDGAPFVLLSGHHDTWHFGVMDNGTANATMLEVARLAAKYRDCLKRGLRVCFWSGHSHGRYAGSAWYADEHWLELEQRCVAHVNVDSTGGAGASVLTRSSVIDELAPLAHAVILAETGQSHEGRRHGRVADQSFWGIGIPSMFGSLSHQPKSVGGPALGWWWHTEHDLADRVDIDNLVRDTRVVLRTIWHLVTTPVLPLDYSVTARSLLSEIDPISPHVSKMLALDALRADIRTLETLSSAVSRSATDATEERCVAVNRGLVAVSRALVPLNYTRGDRFVPDPALEQPAWPCLEPLRLLAGLPAGSPEIPFVATRARQALNRLRHAIRAACRHLQRIV